MTFKQISTLAIALIGFYSIFSAILVSGVQFLILIFSLFGESPVATATQYSLILIPQFAVPLVFGIILVRRSARLSDWLLRKIGADASHRVAGIGMEQLSFLLLSALGLYMLSVAVPDALELFAAWFAASATETAAMARSAGDDFWGGRFPEVIYHSTAVGFAAFVFFRGASVSRFVLAIRKHGLPTTPPRTDDRQSSGALSQPARENEPR